MKTATLTTLVILSISPVLAGEKSPRQQLDELTTSYANLLTVTYTCQDVVGVAFYEGAKAAAKLEFGKYVSPEVVSRTVDEQETTLSENTKKTRKTAKAAICLRLINEAYAKMPK